MFECLELDVRDGVAHLTLNRPDAANGIDLQLAQELLAASLLVVGDPTVRAVLLRGAGARFCGGGDVKSFAAQDDLPAHLREVTTHLHAAVGQLVRGDAPVVTAVQGSAAGAGLGLVASSDLVVAGESAKFVMAYTGIGLTPDFYTDAKGKFESVIEEELRKVDGVESEPMPPQPGKLATPEALNQFDALLDRQEAGYAGDRDALNGPLRAMGKGEVGSEKIPL